jgi:hypothetical protein
MRSVNVAGAVVGNANITLFFTDGKTEVLPQSGFRTAEIMEQIMPTLAKMQTATINLEEFAIVKVIEDLTKGVVKAEASISGEVTMKVNGQEIDHEALSDHIERATLDGSPGFGRFMQKFSEIRRQHTSNELLVFMKGADLPLCDDGSILGFKILVEKAKDDDAPDIMRDKHSKRVPQRLGSLVFMPDSKVNDNRREACGTGLHIAARSYLSGFWDRNARLCLVKIQPKDVIAVPLRETTKMRVSAYHIVKVFSKEDGDAIKDGKSIHDIPSALKLLEEAVGGDIGSIIEKVEVKMDNTVTVTPVAPKTERVVQRKAKKAVKVSQVVKKASADKKGGVGMKIDPKDVKLLKKLIKASPHLADLDNAYLKKLVRAQKMLDDGKSLRTIGEKLGVDRDALGRNLIR